METSKYCISTVRNNLQRERERERANFLSNFIQFALKKCGFLQGSLAWICDRKLSPLEPSMLSKHSKTQTIDQALLKFSV